MHQCGSFKSIHDFYTTNSNNFSKYNISNLRFISVLREPVERDISYFLFAATHISRVRNGKSIPLIDVHERPFEVTKSDESVFPLTKLLCDCEDIHQLQRSGEREKIKKEETEIETKTDTETVRAKKNLKKLVEDEVFFHKLFRGKYVIQLRELEKYFSRKQLLIINSAELLREPHAALSKIQLFLGLDSGWPTATEIGWLHHPVELPDVVANISCAEMKKLSTLYAPWNEELYKWDSSFEKFVLNTTIPCS